jgi:hypothetical protein
MALRTSKSGESCPLRLLVLRAHGEGMGEFEPWLPIDMWPPGGRSWEVARRESRRGWEYSRCRSVLTCHLRYQMRPAETRKTTPRPAPKPPMAAMYGVGEGVAVAVIVVTAVPDIRGGGLMAHSVPQQVRLLCPQQ